MESLEHLYVYLRRKAMPDPGVLRLVEDGSSAESDSANSALLARACVST